MSETKEKKVFKSVDEKIKAIQDLEDDHSLSPEEQMRLVDEYQNAEIQNEETVPKEESTETPAESQPAQNQPAKKEEIPQEQQTKQEQETKQDDPTVWHIKDQTIRIPQDTIMVNGEPKKIFTFKNVQDAIDSIPYAQRTIAHLKKTSKDAEYKVSTATSEKDKRIQDLENQVAELKQNQSSKPSGNESLESVEQKLNETKEKIKGINKDSYDYDPEELTKLLEEKSSLIEKYYELKGKEQTAPQPSDGYKKSEEGSQNQQSQQAQQSQPSMSPEIQQFLSSHPKEFPVQGQEDWGSISKQCYDYEDQIASLFTGKTPENITDADVMVSQQALSSGNPVLKAKVEERGLGRPQNYDTFKAVENVMLYAKGQERDPASGSLKIKRDQYGNPIYVGSMESAWNLMKSSGTQPAPQPTPQQSSQPAKQAQDSAGQMLDAVSRRDEGITTMDTSTSPQGTAEQMTKEEAVAIVQDAGENTQKYAQAKLDQNLDPIHRLNKALEMLGQEPVSTDPNTGFYL